MNVLNLPVVRIGKCLFRKKPTLEHSSDSSDCNTIVSSELESLRLGFHKTIHQNNDHYECSLYIPRRFHHSLIGIQRASQNGIEREFKCKLTFPPPASQDANVSIAASSEAQLLQVCNRLDFIVSKERSSSRPSHILCLPFTNEKMQQSFESFKEQVLQRTEGSGHEDFLGICSDLFCKASKLHFTIATLLLADEEELTQARNILQELQTYEDIKRLMKTPLKLSVCGFDYMNDEPKSTKVLYAKLVDNDDAARLQEIARRLAEAFTKTNLIHRFSPGETVKLHLTLMNSRLRSERDSRRNNSSYQLQFANSKAFSIVGILRELSDFVFIEEGVADEIHLSLINDPSTGSNSFYHCDGKMSFLKT